LPQITAFSCRIHEEGHAAEAHKPGGAADVALHGQLRAKRRGLQRPAALDEQGLGHPRLQHGKRARHRGLRQTQHCGPFGHAASVRNGGKPHPLTFSQLHNTVLYCRPNNSS
jgi:hypothetical protein